MSSSKPSAWVRWYASISAPLQAGLQTQQAEQPDCHDHERHEDFDQARAALSERLRSRRLTSATSPAVSLFPRLSRVSTPSRGLAGDPA